MRNDNRALLKQLDKGRYEETEHGILMPEAGVLAAGQYVIRSTGYDDEVSDNTLTTEGLNYLLEAGLRGGAQLATFHVALFANDYTPTPALTAAAFPATAGEITSNSQGYTEATRQAWTPAAAAGGMTDNTGALCTFTIATSSSLTIRGAALLSDDVKGSTLGVLISATKFPNARTQYDGDTFTTGYRITLNPV